jgi:hypothetical protein
LSFFFFGTIIYLITNPAKSLKSFQKSVYPPRRQTES